MSEPVSPEPRRTDIPVRQSESPNECGREAPWESAEALAAFLAEHVKPYDPETDDYDRPPFASDIKEGKNDPIYNAHSYHTKVPPRSIIPYILHYTQPGDVVLDPFCGSGMTGVAAQMCAHPPADILTQFPEFRDRVGPRVCVLNDLSSAACHIAYNYNTPVDVDALRGEFDRIKAAAKEEFDCLYGTEHYEPALGRYAPSNPDVACLLKDSLEKTARSQTTLFDREERAWELITKAEVEERLGYPVSELPPDQNWGDVDLARVKQWVCIPATIQYTIWSDVYRCEGFVTIEEPTGRISTRGKNVGRSIVEKRRVARGCGKDIVLRNASLVHGHDDRQGSTFTCPHCGTTWQKSPLQWLRSDPVDSCVEATGIDGRTRNYRRKISRREIELACEVPRSEHWYPTDQLYENRELLTMGAGKRGIKRVCDFYFPRQLRALASLFAGIEGIEDSRVKRAALFCFTAIVLKCSRLNRLRPSGAGDPLTGTLYIGSLVREENTSIVWQRRTEVASTALSQVKSKDVLVRQGDAGSLWWMPDSSVDFVFADPPFGGNIFYADASLLWESWLRSYTDVRAEMVIHRRSKSARLADGFVFKEIEDYSSDMSRGFKEMFRVLKPGRWAVVEFNNSDGAVFDVIKRGVAAAGFEIANMLLLDKQQRSFKQVQGVLGKEEVVDKDVLFNLLKPCSTLAESESQDHDLEHQIADAVRQHLQTLPDRIKAESTKYSDEHRTTATINSMLMNVLIPRGVSVERLNLPFIERVCARYFRKVGQYWYLRGQAVGNGTNQDGLFEEEVQVRDEVTAIEWLRQKLHAAPMLVGELKPFWMRATGLLPAAVSQALSLEDLLAENFWRDLDTNRWREPTDEERERMNDDRSIRVLHDAERYVAGSLRRSTTDAERSDWIDVLFKACREVEDDEARSTPALRGFDCSEGYRLVARLFQTILKEHVPAADFNRAQKQAAAASKRITQDVREEDIRRQADAGKKRGPTLFDMEDVT